MIRTTKLSGLIIPFVVTLLLLVSGAPGQTAFPAMKQRQFPATVQAHIYPSVAFPGESVRLDVTVTLDEGHYTYAFDPVAVGPVPTLLTLEETEALLPIEGSDWTEPKPKRKFDKGFNADVDYHTGKLTFSRTYRVADIAPATYELKGSARLQICTDTFCLPPRKLAFAASLKINAPAGAASTDAATSGTETVAPLQAEETPAPSAPEPEPENEEPASAVSAAAIDTPQLPSPPVQWNKPDDLRAAGFGTLIWTAFIAGLVALMTPCVFPLIPITISFFTKRAHGSPAQRIGLASIYSGSIVLGFALLGFGLAIVLKTLNISVGSGVIAQFAANPWLNIVLAAIFVLFAFSLFGAFDIQLPSSWANRLQQKQRNTGDIISAILMAMIFVIVSFTCTAPIVGPLIVLAFEGNWLRPFVGLTAYGVGFAAPFFILGLVPGALRALPKSGTWLNATKVTMGLVEMALALKFISNTDLVWNWGIFTREVLLACWAAIALVTMIYLLGAFRLHHDTEQSGIGPMRLTMSLLFGTAALYFAFGLFSGKLHSSIESLLPPSRQAEEAQMAAIINDLDRAKLIAKEQDKPIFIDFTGWTCTNCRLNEIEVFPKPQVKSLLDEYIIVKLYTDDAEHGEKYQAYQEERFGTFAIPYYAVLTPDDQVVGTFAGLIQDESQFVRFLESAL